jgi:K+-sensing histidine kinase KdpD
MSPHDAESVLSIGGDDVPSPTRGSVVEGASRRIDVGPAETQGLAGLRTFLEELRRSFSHDLRTPLGTIVNYAALLESAEGVALSDQHNFARHIRRNAMRAANMLEHLSSAAILASRPAAPETVDVEDLLERALLASGGKDRIRVVSDGDVPPLDSALLQFVWTSYVSLETDVRGQAPTAVELAILPAEGRVVLTVTIGDAEAAKLAPIELSRFLADAGENARPESRHALRLAADVIELHGGSIALFGRAGASSSLSLTLPLS